MKILIVNKYHYLRGGDCRYVFELSKLLEKHGNEVRHFSMAHPKNIPYEHESDFVSYIDFPQELESRGKLRKIKTVMRMLYSREARKKFSALLDEFRPDIIHLNNIHKHITTSIILEANKRHIPIVWTLHDYNLICPNISFVAGNKICEVCKRMKILGPAMTKCSNDSLAASIIITAEGLLHRLQKIKNRINYFISPSQFLREKFIEYGFDAGKILVLPNFSNQFYTPEIEIADSRYFLYMGRISREKGVETLCKAAQKAKIRLLIAGEGPLKDELSSKYQSDRIKFIGYKQGEELKQLRANAWFVVIPSEWYENNPYSVIESFGDEVPVIGSRIGGIPELVLDGRTGFLFESGNAQQLQRLLAKADNISYEEHEMLGKFAKEQVSTWNNPEVYYESLVNIYRKAIAEEETKWKH